MTPSRLTIKTKPITSLELYKTQVQNMYDRLRAGNLGKSHLPAQLGGTYGQRQLLTEKNVLDVTEIT